jgi:hypothetical protein
MLKIEHWNKVVLVQISIKHFKTSVKLIIIGSLIFLIEFWILLYFKIIFKKKLLQPLIIMGHFYELQFLKS